MSERVRSAPVVEAEGPPKKTSTYVWFLGKLFRAGPTGLDMGTLLWAEREEGAPSPEKRIEAYRQAVAAGLVCAEPSIGRIYATPDKARFHAAQAPDKQAPNEAEAAA